MKGQGSTEYLVIFAAVLVVALIVIYLLGQFGAFGQKSLIDSSKSAWAGMTPIAITNWGITSSDGQNMTFSFKNQQMRKVTITNITLSDIAPASSVNIVLYPGSEKETTIQFSSALCTSSDSGSMKEFDVVITYTMGTSSFKEVGNVPLRVVCP